jgi:hypothetical protein
VLNAQTNSAFDFLCLLARPKPDLDHARAALRAGVDFVEVYSLAADQGVRPRIIQSLRALSWEGVPADVKASFDGFQRAHFIRMLTWSEELCRVTDLLSRNGIQFAAFKGATLAVTLYGDLSDREYNDIDIIVRAEQMAQAEDLLVSLGYRGPQGDRPFRQAFMSYQRQYALHRADIGSSVDLHWDFCGVHLPFPLRPEDVWRALDDVAIGDSRVPTLATMNLALLLAGHGMKEAWKDLSWVCDFAMLIDRNPDLDWYDIYRRAKSLGCGNAVLVGCAMAHALLEVPVPATLMDLVARSSRVRFLAASFVERMRHDIPLPWWKRNFADIDLCDGWFNKVRAIVQLAVTPTTGDYEAMKLPSALWGLYHALRPLRLVGKVFKGLQ